MDGDDNKDSMLNESMVFLLLFLYILMYISFIFLHIYAFIRGKKLEIILKLHNNTVPKNCLISHYTISSVHSENDAQFIKHKQIDL